MECTESRQAVLFLLGVMTVIYAAALGAGGKSRPVGDTAGRGTLDPVSSAAPQIIRCGRRYLALAASVPLSRASKKICQACMRGFLYIAVLVARRPVMEKVADKPGLFAAR